MAANDASSARTDRESAPASPLRAPPSASYWATKVFSVLAEEVQAALDATPPTPPRPASPMPSASRATGQPSTLVGTVDGASSSTLVPMQLPIGDSRDDVRAPAEAATSANTSLLLPMQSPAADSPLAPPRDSSAASDGGAAPPPTGAVDDDGDASPTTAEDVPHADPSAAQVEATALVRAELRARLALLQSWVTHDLGADHDPTAPPTFAVATDDVDGAAAAGGASAATTPAQSHVDIGTLVPRLGVWLQLNLDFLAHGQWHAMELTDERQEDFSTLQLLARYNVQLIAVMTLERKVLNDQLLRPEAAAYAQLLAREQFQRERLQDREAAVGELLPQEATGRATIVDDEAHLRAELVGGGRATLRVLHETVAAFATFVATNMVDGVVAPAVVAQETLQRRQIINTGRRRLECLLQLHPTARLVRRETARCAAWSEGTAAAGAQPSKAASAHIMRWGAPRVPAAAFQLACRDDAGDSRSAANAAPSPGGQQYSAFGQSKVNARRGDDSNATDAANDVATRSPGIPMAPAAHRVLGGLSTSAPIDLANVVDFDSALPPGLRRQPLWWLRRHGFAFHFGDAARGTSPRRSTRPDRQPAAQQPKYVGSPRPGSPPRAAPGPAAKPRRHSSAFWGGAGFPVPPNPTKGSRHAWAAMDGEHQAMRERHVHSRGLWQTRVPNPMPGTVTWAGPLSLLLPLFQQRSTFQNPLLSRQRRQQ